MSTRKGHTRLTSVLSHRDDDGRIWFRSPCTCGWTSGPVPADRVVTAWESHAESTKARPDRGASPATSVLIDRGASPVTSVLIVDDDEGIRLLVRHILETAGRGFEVVSEASDGETAVTAWRALDGPPVPDVVILDNRMPRLTGIGAARQILTERPEQLVVLYSAFIDDPLRAEAAEVGVAACVSKDQLRLLPDLVRALAA